MAKWTSGSSNQFCQDVVKNNNGGIWALRSILVQVCFGGLWHQECCLHSTDRHYSMEINAWGEEVFIPISRSRLQGMGSSQLVEKRKWQAYTTSNWSYPSWISAQYQLVFILHSGKEYNDVFQSSTIWWNNIPVQEQRNDRKIPVWPLIFYFEQIQNFRCQMDHLWSATH